ncbi:hypothetical protein AAFC00_004043 [Neodothiora populina]|uniref:Histone acetyltransferase type B catalytic subunit n=1 Tax=Neodothiora populina TaxID=2781224 RepID=A0ABR3PIC2_9PEZI
MSDRSESPEGSDVSDISETLQNQVDDWSSNTTDACNIIFFRGKNELARFSPACTYPIFGEEEAVFGYKGLDISLSFASHNLKPHVSISWDEKWEDRGEIKASDVRAALADFLPESAFEDESLPTDLSESEAAEFSPPGVRIEPYSIGGRNYEIWCARLVDPLAREMMENAQVLVPLFIEGGTELQMDHDWINERWKIFFLYEICDKSPGTSPYSMVGFATSYQAFSLPDRSSPAAGLVNLLESEGPDSILDLWSPEDTEAKMRASRSSTLDLPSRERISQFIILPPYQGSGHGPQLYNKMYTFLIARNNVFELTVEDPNEAFDDMRDACDLVYLRDSEPDFDLLTINVDVETAKLKPNASIPVDDIVDGSTKKFIRTHYKIVPRQSARLVEMQTLSKIPTFNRNPARITKKEKSSNKQDRAYYFWRLYVKQRLYETHRDTLMELDHEDRIKKLEDTVNTVQADYERLLALAEKRANHATKVQLPVLGAARKERKRKVIVLDESDDDSAGVVVVKKGKTELK